MTARIVAAILAIASAAAPATGADPPDPSAVAATDPARPRTCLVLSGGGARGAAHIGVLQVLEDLRVPFDCIVGTSMGAVVGGLFATGLSPDTIDGLVRDSDWRDLFSDRPPRRDIPFRRKQDDTLPLFRFEFGLKHDGFVLPGGVVAGQKLDFLLKQLTLPSAGVDSFDRLAIPFRAVATDLSDGSKVVLDRGNLADAIRASMSVPGAFTPVDIDGRTLVDGGIVDNLPIDVARELGASRVLAIDVSMPLDVAEQDRSVFGVAIQTINVLTEQNIVEQREAIRDGDAMIRIEMPDTTSAQFERMPEIVGVGAETAREAADRLRTFAVSEGEYGAWIRRHRAWRERQTRTLTIDAVEITGLDRIDPRIVTRQVRTRPGDALDLDVLQDDLGRVYRLGDFERVGFQVEVAGEPERTVLRIDAAEKSWGPNFVRFGLGLQADFKGRGDFNLLADFTRTRVNTLGAEWKSRVSVGRDNSAFTEFYQPLDFGSHWFVAPAAIAERRLVDVFEDDGAITERRIGRVEGGGDLGVQFSQYGEFRVGFRRGATRVENRSLADAPVVRSDTGAWVGSLTLDRLDNANFPRWGSLIEAEGRFARAFLAADDEYDRLETTYLEARSFGRNTIVARLRYGTGLGSEIPVYDEFSLGGMFNMSGFPRGALRGSELGFAQLLYYRELGTLPGPLGGGLYVGLSAEAGNVWATRDEASFSDLRPAGLVWAGVDTVFGPVTVGYGRSDSNVDSLYLALGQVF